MSAVVQYESLVDDTTKIFLEQTEALFASKNAVCDFALWLQFYAFDIIGSITYGKRHGFIDRNEDVDGMVAYMGRLFSYVAPVIRFLFNSLLSLKDPLIRLYVDWSDPIPRPALSQEPRPPAS